MTKGTPHKLHIAHLAQEISSERVAQGMGMDALLDPRSLGMTVNHRLNPHAAARASHRGW